MLGLKRDVLYDLDASLSSSFGNANGVRTSAAIINNFNHISNYNQLSCRTPTDLTKWGGTIMCDQSVTIRRIYFTNLLNLYTFNAQFMKVTQLTSYDQVVDYDPVNDAGLFTAVQSRF
jgi:hypothetical protein